MISNLELHHQAELEEAELTRLFVYGTLLQGEGFTDIRYVKKPFLASEDAFASGDVDIAMAFVVPMIPRIDAGHPIVVLGGVHVGCVEVFATERVRTIRDLKGKTFAIESLREGTHFFMAALLAQVGLNVESDINWATFAAWSSETGISSAVTRSRPSGRCAQS